MLNHVSSPSAIEFAASLLLAFAVLHTFATSLFQRVATRFPEGSFLENLFHLLGEVEVVFGLWAGVLLVVMAALEGPAFAAKYAQGLSFAEPIFVFAIMVVSATRPVLSVAQGLILLFSRVLPVARPISLYVACLVAGPLLGSFITEPAAMTVCALLLQKRYFARPEVSTRFKYLTLAVLFVNVSIGGVLTPFAAPPVLLVAGKWGWDTGFMLTTFGFKAVLAAAINASLAAWILRKEILSLRESPPARSTVPAWLTLIHLLFLAGIVVLVHQPVIFMGALLLFLGVVTATREHQDPVRLRESLLVAFFLGGLVVLGGSQGWWLTPVLSSADSFPLFLGATALTAITDNAALTYLGSQVPGTSESFRYALVAGAVAGGGLTVIANAPNPAGYAILQSSFGSDGIHPLRLLVAALFPTLVAMASFWLL